MSHLFSFKDICAQVMLDQLLPWPLRLGIDSSETRSVQS